ncbi:MAG: ribbon-helix-helix protein, CopG family [Chromatiales bacterium]
MKTLSLKLPDELAARLSHAVRKQGQTQSELVRKAVERYLRDSHKAVEGCVLDLCADLAGCVRGSADLSSNRKHLRGYGE